MGQRAGEGKLRVEIDTLEQGWDTTTALPRPIPPCTGKQWLRLKEGSCERKEKREGWGPNPHSRTGKREAGCTVREGPWTLTLSGCH